MSYQALARKWRPKTFSELVGQEHVVTALTNALTRNRLHHAYLLTGTRGVGKTTTARDMPTVGRFKVYLIDEVHMLSKAAFNSMLKTLEEPPEHVKFVLATTDPQKIPVTVLSRCLQFNLKQLSPALIADLMAAILKGGGIG